MKKILTASMVLFIFGFYTVAYSQTVGNTAMVSGSSGGWSFGLEYGMVKRDMAFDGGDTKEESIPADPSDESGPIVFDPGEGVSGEEFTSERIFLKATKQITPKIAVSVKAGQADTDIDLTRTLDRGSLGFITDKYQFDGDSGFGGGVGVKGEIGSWGAWTIFGDIQYLMSKVEGNIFIDGVDEEDELDIDTAKLNALCPTCKFRNSYDAEAIVTEYHLALYAAQTIGIWTPYGGIKYSDLRVEIDRKASIFGASGLASNEIHLEFKADDNVGVLIGTDVEITSKLRANIEFRFIDETSTSLGVTWQF